MIYTTRQWSGFTFGNSTFAAMYIFPAFLLSIYWVYTQTQENRRWWMYLMPLLFVINPYVINRELWFGKLNVLQHPFTLIGEAQATSYTVLFSTFALLVIWLVSKIKKVSVRRTLLITTGILGVIVGILAVRSFLSTDGYLRTQYLKQASLARPIAWNLAQKAIAERPVLGWGPDNFDRAFEAYYDNRLLVKR
jgi:O-antigen ligase